MSFWFKAATSSSTETGALMDGAKCAHCGHGTPLGYNCDTCSETFCIDCLPYKVHTCTGHAHETHADPMVPVKRFMRCSHPGCSEKLLVEMHCRYCQKAFCSAHLIEGDHDCTVFKADAAARLKEAEDADDAKAAKAARAPHRAGKPRAAAALRPEGLHQDDGMAFTVLTPPGMCHRSNPHKVVFNRHHGVGKSMDWLTEALGIERQRLALLCSRTLKPLPTILSPFKQLVQRGVLQQSDVLLLVPAAWVAEPQAVRSCAQEAAAVGDSHWEDALRRCEILVC